MDPFVTLTAGGKEFSRPLQSTPVPRTVTVLESSGGTAFASAALGGKGQAVSLAAVPDPGYRFAGWQVVSGDVLIQDSAFIIGRENVEIRAVFSPVRVAVRRFQGTSYMLPSENFTRVIRTLNCLASPSP